MNNASQKNKNNKFKYREVLFIVLVFLLLWLITEYVLKAGYCFLEPIGWHNELKKWLPNIDSAWIDYGESRAANVVTYAWLPVIALIISPFFITLNFFAMKVLSEGKNAGEDPAPVLKARPIVGMFFMMTVTIYIYSSTARGSRFSSLLYDSGSFGLAITLFLLLGIPMIFFQMLTKN